MLRFKNQGFVLISVLVVLQMLAALSLYGLMQAKIIVKQSTSDFARFEFQQQAKLYLQEIEKRQINSAACLIPPIAPTLIARQSLSWWQRNGCADPSGLQRYYYVVEALGQDDCGKVGVDQIADYYRVTLYVIANKLYKAHLIWQYTSVLAFDKIGNCRGMQHVVLAGRQMLREL